MAIPNHYIKRRDLLHSERTPPAVMIRTGEELYAAERYSEALDFFEKAQHADGFAKIKALALKTGNTFLLGRLERHDRKLVAREDWDAAATIAEQNGRASMAKFVAKKFAAAAVPGTNQTTAVSLPGAAPLEE